MELSEYLSGIKCECGREHSCAIKSVIVEENAISKLNTIIGGYKNILIVADKNTYEVCGLSVTEQCKNKCETVFVFDDDGILVPNEYAIERMTKKISDKTDLIIGIGSGVIQDLCKYVSFNNGLQYIIVATAPSMDGYASVGAAMITGNMKVTYSAHVPMAIIGDLNILKNAPMDMIVSGYGDILGKFSCLNDWKLSRIVNDEYFCEYVYDMTYQMLMKTKDIGKDLTMRKPEAIKILFEALVGVGIAMAYVGNSRPASGSEHHLSHFFEVIGIINNEDYFLHGTDVAYSTVITERLREELIKAGRPEAEKAFDKCKWEKDIRSIYGVAADGIISLQSKTGFYEKSMAEVYNKKWDEIVSVLKECPSSAELEEMLGAVGLSMKAFEDKYGEEKIHNAIKYAMDLKDRYTVLRMYNSLI